MRVHAVVRRLRRIVLGPRRVEYRARCPVCAEPLRSSAEDLTVAETVEFVERAHAEVARHCEERSM